MFEGISIGDLTPPALLGLAVLLLLFGKIVPRATLMDKSKEAQQWREAYEKEREARSLSEAQNAELLELGKTTYNVLVAMFGTTERIRNSDEGANNVASSTE
jgi:hypothetical protein